jgi:hypothetical protein
MDPKVLALILFVSFAFTLVLAIVLGFGFANLFRRVRTSNVSSLRLRFPPADMDRVLGRHLPVLRYDDELALRSYRSVPIWRRFLRIGLPAVLKRQNGRGSITDQEARTCAVCLVDFGNSDEVCRLRCGHLYHPPCIYPWLLASKSTCPVW